MTLSVEADKPRMSLSGHRPFDRLVQPPTGGCMINLKTFSGLCQS